MRKRNVHIQVWLDRKEAENLDKKVRRSGLSRAAYLRHLINGVVPQDAPPLDYFDMMQELHGIGKNLNQIAQKRYGVVYCALRGRQPSADGMWRTVQGRNTLPANPLPTQNTLRCGNFAGKRI